MEEKAAVKPSSTPKMALRGSYGSLPSSADLMEGQTNTLGTSYRQNCEYLFKYIILTQIFMYMEAGAVPALLEQFTDTFNLSPQEQGLLGAVVYMAISAASPMCSPLFKKFSPKLVLGISLIVNNVSVLCFALTPTLRWYSQTILIFLRGMIGFTQGFHCVYSPLWVHDYAPKDKKAGWMSYLQGAVPIGITAGYLAGSVSVWSAVYPETVDSIVGANNATEHVNRTLTILGDVGTSTIGLCNGIYCWRWPFIFQFVVVLPFSLLIFCVPNEHIRTKFKKRQSLIVVETLIDDETVSGNMTPNTIERVASEEDPVNAAAVKIQTIIVEQGKTKKRHMLVRAVYNVMQLLRHRVYLFVVLGLSALFFVVAGVQFWTTLYLSTNTNDSAYRIHWSYLVVSGTGPILGVFFGGWLIDQFGGYAGRYQEAKTLRICVVLGILAVAAAIPVSYVHNTLQIAVCLWIMLFAGGSILPACSGIVIASTPRRLRPLASSFAYTCYNLLGYAASNYIPGLIMDFIIDQRNESASHGEKLTEGEGCDAACTYRVGFRIVLLWSIWALLCLLIATYFSCQNAKKESLAINMTELNGGEIVPVNVSLQAPCVSATGGATVDAIPPIRTTQTVL